MILRNSERPFNQRELILYSGLSQGQIKILQKHDLLESPEPLQRYTLVNIVYCRIVYRLRQFYSAQQIRNFLPHCDYFGKKLLDDDNDYLAFDNNTCFCSEDSLIKPFRASCKKLKECFVYREKIEFQHKIDGVVSVDCLYINLALIRRELAV